MSSRWALFALVAVAVIAVEATVAGQLAATDRPTLVAATIAVDVTVGLPLLAWLLVVRRRLVRQYRALRPAAVYGFDALQEATSRGFGISPRLAAAVTTDITMLALAALGWRRRYDPPPGATAFTAHRAGGYGGMAIMLGSATQPEDALALVPLGDPALVIELDRPVTVDGLFGLRREARVLAIAADDPAALQAALARRMLSD